MIQKNKSLKIKSILRSRFTLLVAIIPALSILFLLYFQTLHTGHEEHCHDKNCAICLVLQIVSNTNKFFCKLNTSLDFSLSFIYINILILSALLLVPSTLVSQNIKLVI